MDTPARTIVKSLTWQAMGLVTTTAIGFLYTGSVAASGGIAITVSIAGLIFYIAHERAWARICWGLHPRDG